MRPIAPIAKVLTIATILSAPASAQQEEIARLAASVAESPASSEEGQLQLTEPYKLPARHLAPHVTTSADDPGPAVVSSAASVRYQYDDNSFESGAGTEGYALQVAQRFRLGEAGRIRWIEACFWREQSDNTADHAFAFDVLSDRNGSPGSSIIGDRQLIKEGRVAAFPRDTCFRMNYSRQVPRGDLWIAVLFFGDDGLEELNLPGLGKLLSGDTGSPRNTVARAREVEGSGDQVTGIGPWSGFSSINAVGIRMSVEHEDDPPPPDPEPPPTDGPCLPTTDVLQFDGGYRVSMCYVTPNGETGQAKAGVWASSQSGILWFFSRENAEVLVKVLDGCRHNGHRWIFVAPVTDLGFELRVTGPSGEIWTHTNQSGRTAPTKSDTSAFKCQ